MRTKGMKLLSKIVAVCFAMILTVSMSVPAQAKIAKNEIHTITVTGKDTDGGATVDIYKIIDVHYDYDVQQPVSPTYTWVDAVAEWLTTQKGFESYIENENEVPKSFENVDGADLSAFMNALEKSIESGEIHLDKAASATMGEQKPTLVFDNMEMGYYLILTTADTQGEHKDYEYAPATAKIVPVYDETKKEWFAYDAEVTIKGSPGSIEKDVDDNTVEIGQVVNYTVNVPVPYYPEDAVAKLFRIGDYLPIGITFGQTYEENQLTVNAVYENGEKQTIGTSEMQQSDYFDLYYDAKDNGKDGIEGNLEPVEGQELADFILDFKYDELVNQFGTYEANGVTTVLKAIEVTYQGTINENAILRPEDPGYPEGSDPLENKAYVGQNNNPYDWDSYTPTEDKEKVYTYAIEVTKVEEDGKTPLAGAEFQLFRKEKTPVMEFVKLKDGTYRLAKADDEDTTTTLAVNSEGKLDLEGLTTGTYYLQETKAPDGYELLEELIEIKIIDEDEDGIVDDAGNIADNSKITNIVYKTVVNRKPPIMPITGGMGTIIFSIVGIILVAGGITLIISYQRRRRA